MLGRVAMLWILGALVFVAGIVELGRFRWQPFARWFYRLTGKLLRDHERKSLTGSTCLFLGSFLTVLLFSEWVAVVVLFFLAVADAFDTMTTNRAYRAARDVESAIDELRKCAGAHFCPVAVEAFIAGFEKQGNNLVQLDSQYCNSELLTHLLSPPNI